MERNFWGIKSKRSANIIKFVVAVFFIIIGISGIILPILPGWPFIFAAIFLLGGIEGLRKKVFHYLPKKWVHYIEKQIENLK